MALGLDIGIYTDGDADRLLATIASLRHEPHRDRLLVLLEPGADIPDSLATAADVDIVHTLRVGAATAFNALLEVSRAPSVIFLESGVCIAPGALRRLQGALLGSTGLAGPSTNLAENQQCQPDAPASAEVGVLEAYARGLVTRFGDQVHELPPLRSLADLCLAVRREPMLGLGGADDAYDPGPCWEVDLGVRAHRAGWRSVWAKSAYVHRAPTSGRRRERHAEMFSSNTRRFQDRFCGPLIRGSKGGHSPRCLEDACPEFAPAELLRSICGRPSLVQMRPASVFAGPLVSCILPTCSRPGFVAEAVRGFLEQDYPRRELIVVDDGDSPVAHLLPHDERIRYHRLPGRRPIGAKRNFACERARGEVIAHLDDDDWYPSNRLTLQVRALQESGRSLCGSSRLFFADLMSHRAWLYSYPCGGWVAGTSMVYRRSFWESQPFCAEQVAEDWHFARAASARDTLLDLEDANLCVATVHDHNTSTRDTENLYWSPVDAALVRQRLGGRFEAYRAAAAGQAPTLPLVSCTMPTADRPELVDLAIKKFQAQDYPCKELVILDKGRRSVEALAREQPGVRYQHLDRSDATIGEMRNIVCSLARGEVICLWDDDDWYSPERLRCQVLPIVYDDADITGLKCDHFVSLPSGEVWSVSPEVHRRMFESDVAGGTIAFRRAIFDHVRFPCVNLAEDAAFIRMARARGCRLKGIASHGVFAYVRHPKNTWGFQPGQFCDPKGWRRSELPAGFSSSALAAHRRACQSWLAKLASEEARAPR